MTLANWDELEPYRSPHEGLGGAWTQLGTPAGSKTVGLNRLRLEPGEVSTPAHVHGADEELFFVLAGSGLSWQDGETHEIRAGDCLVHAPLGKAHTLRGGEGGLDVLAYGTRTRSAAPSCPRSASTGCGPRGPKPARSRIRSTASSTSTGPTPRRGPPRSSTSTTSRATTTAARSSSPGRPARPCRDSTGAGSSRARTARRRIATRPRRSCSSSSTARARSSSGAARSPASPSRPSRRRRTRSAAAASSPGRPAPASPTPSAPARPA